MPKKRANGEGTKYSKRPNGTWAAQITVGRDPATGKLKRLTFSGKTRKEVQEKLTAALAQLQQGIFVEPNKTTAGEWLDIWLNEYKKPPKVRPTTWQNYKTVIRCHIKPAIGHILLRQPQPSHLHRLYNEKFDNGRVDGQGGLSDRTVWIIHTVMHASLKQVMKEGLVARNVAEATTLPKREKEEPRVLTLEEQRRFFEVLSQDRLTLDTYSHVLPELKKAAAAKLNTLWQKEKAPSLVEGN